MAPEDNLPSPSHDKPNSRVDDISNGQRIEGEYLPGPDEQTQSGDDRKQNTVPGFEGAIVPPPTVLEKQITFDSLPTALNLPQPNENTEWIFENFIERGNIVQVNYKRGIGGTWFILDLISAATTNRKLYGHYDSKRTVKSLFVNSGLETDKISERISSVLGSQHLNEVKILSRSWILDTTNYDDFDFSEKKWQDLVTFGIKRNPEYNLLALDDLGTLFKKKPDQELFYSWLYDLKQLGVTVIALCESGKGIKLPADLVDVDLNISTIESDKIKNKVEFLSARRLPKNLQEDFAIELVEDENNLFKFNRINLKKDLVGKICFFIVNGYTQAEAARLLGLHQSTVSRKFDDALNQGIVSKSGRIYKLTEKGMELTKGMQLPGDD